MVDDTVLSRVQHGEKLDRTVADSSQLFVRRNWSERLRGI